MIRIGIVGCGRILAAHLRGYQVLREAGVDNFRITALTARKIGDAQMYVQRGEGPPQRPPVGVGDGDPLAIGDMYLSDFQDDVDVQTFTDYETMMDSGSVDAVNDFTTHAMHLPIAEAALSRGLHLMTQKPLAHSMSAGRRMCDLADRQGVVLSVFENARFRADTRQLAWLFQDSDIIGRLQLITTTNLGNWWAPDRIVAETPWRHERAAGGGLALDIGVHLFHHLRYVAGEISAISALTPTLQRRRVTRDASGAVSESISCDADDTLLGTFRTERDVVGSLTLSWTGHGAPLKTGAGRGIAYYGERGSVCDDTVTRDGGETHSLAELYESRAGNELVERHFPHGVRDAFALNQLDWLTAIQQSRRPETSGREGLLDLACAFSLLESSLAKREVTVAEVLSGELSAYNA
ncbi:MAG: Gfo/Idh/MocA family oxidoreductase [Pirellulaceae bacterium]|nr:Gfo/Idh/MocA family oxidoreductase [Pirellulaceae bacterium]MDP7014231.1 Gfo/Idh/MocA family oxidoreductase [Pirellulaceae bacterium]